MRSTINDRNHSSFSSWLSALAFIILLCAAISRVAAVPLPVEHDNEDSPKGPGSVIVTPKFGGEILGFGTDASGTEGLLSEYVDLQGGAVLSATETFDLKTGKIVKVLAKKTSTSTNQYSTWGVFGNHIGLDEHYLPSKQEFQILNPLDENKFTGSWTPKIPSGYLPLAMSENQGEPNVAVALFENGGDGHLAVFSSNIAANTFGKQFAVKDSVFGFYNSPVLAYDSKTNQAVLASSNGCRNCGSEIATVNLTSGKIVEFAGLGFGFVNGIAVDPDAGIAVTTSEIDAGVEFYDLAKQAGIEVTLPCSNDGGQQFSGGDVEFDSVHKLFLVEQPDTIGCAGGSDIVVYDEKGNVVENLEGFPQLPVSPTLIALHPSDRSGFVFGNNFGTALQSFTY